MNGKLVLTLGFAGVLALSMGFAKDFQSTEELAEEQKVVENMSAKVGFVPQVNETRFFFTKEELKHKKDVYTVISIEEQEMVESSPFKEGFVTQENGTGFYFTKECVKSSASF